MKILLEEKDENEVFNFSKPQIRQRLSGKIEFKNVDFSYDGEAKALKNVSFEIEVGEKIGIVGHTGSGKTSTVSLLARLYEFQNGDILLDGVSIRKFDLKALRQQIGFVSQDPVIFRGTLRENILSAVENPAEFPDSEIYKYCKKAGFLRNAVKITRLLGLQGAR